MEEWCPALKFTLALYILVFNKILTILFQPFIFHTWFRFYDTFSLNISYALLYLLGQLFLNTYILS